MSRLGPSPRRKVAPDELPMARCNQCGMKYNPYSEGLGNCPECDD